MTQLSRSTTRDPDMLSTVLASGVAVLLVVGYALICSVQIRLVLIAPFQGEWPWNRLFIFEIPGELSALSSCDPRVHADAVYYDDAYVTGLSWREQKALRIASTACKAGPLPDDIVRVANKASLMVKSTDQVDKPPMNDAKRALSGHE